MLNQAQKDLLAKAPKAWAQLPLGIGCTSKALIALEVHELVEVRMRPRPGEARAVWEWQLLEHPLGKNM